MATIRSFEVVPWGVGYAIAAGGQILAEPIEASDPQTIIRFAQDFARERGWVVSHVPPGGIGQYDLTNPIPMPEAPPPPTALLTITLPPPAAASITRLLKETGDTPGAMIAKAIGLYMMAVDAKKRGKAVGAADTPDALDTEFTGF